MDSLHKATLTPAEFCQEFGISRNTVGRLLAQGKIPAIRLGRRWFIPRVALETWLAGARADQEAD